jgi:hypothetical protein
MGPLTNFEFKNIPIKGTKVLLIHRIYPITLGLTSDKVLLIIF